MHASGNIWTLANCGNPSSVVLCVNCADYCSLTQSQRDGLMWLISPLFSTQSSIGKLSVAYFQFSVNSPPPSVLSMSLPSSTITITSVTIHLQFSGPGSVVCAAYTRRSGTIPQSTDGLLVQNAPVDVVVTGSRSSMVGAVSYTLGGLFPATSYAIYCGSISPSTVTMNSASMLRTRTIALTSCCRPVSITLTRTTFTDLSNLQSALVVDIGLSAPRDSVSVQLFATPMENMTSTLYPFAPASVTFSSDGAHQVHSSRDNG
jgi:hypothetical protein